MEWRMNRHDPRADPDDEPNASRIDVVEVERGNPGDILSSAANNLRRELAKLHQQAAAVERTLEDHRRERTEAIDKLQRSAEATMELEDRLAQAEAEINSLRRLQEVTLGDLHAARSERDDLQRAVEAAKTSLDDLGKLKTDLEEVRRSRDAAERNAATKDSELAEIRKRQQADSLERSDTEAELEGVRAMLERAKAELVQAREAEEKLQKERDLAKEDASKAHEASQKVRSDADAERESARELLADLERRAEDAAAVREKVSAAERDLVGAKGALDEAKASIARLEGELTAMKNARDTNAELAAVREKALSAANEEIDRLRADREAALANASRADLARTNVERERDAVLESTRRLREELSTAFTRHEGDVRAGRSALPPRLSSPPRASVPSPSAKETSQAPAAAASAAPPASSPVTTSASGSPPAESGTSSPATTASDSKSAPKHVHRPPSTPPLDDEAWTSPTEPDGTAIARAIDALEVRVAAGSIPPLSRVPTAPPPSLANPKLEEVTRVVLAKNAEDPDLEVDEVEVESDDLFANLDDPASARATLDTLRDTPEVLRGVPPKELVDALTHLDYDAEAAVFELARLWEREPMCHALLRALKDQEDLRLREHAAWLLKHLGAATAWKSIADMAKNESEPVPLRRWLIEALDRLAAGRSVGWRELGDIVTALAKHPDPTIRDGVVGVLTSLETSEDKRRLLVEILEHDDDEGVLTSAMNALGNALPSELDPKIVARLTTHPSSRVQRNLKELEGRIRETF